MPVPFANLPRALRLYPPDLVMARVEALSRKVAQVGVVDLLGQQVVVKRLRAKKKSRLAVAATWMLCGAVMREYPRVSVLRSRAADYEARRLRQLRLAEQRVPALYVQTDKYMVQEFCGPTVEQAAKHLKGQALHALLARCADDLSRFHHAGQWHGGSQLRNITVHGHQLYRIDFEEHIGDVVSLPLAQAFDVALFCTSVSDVLHDELQTATGLLARYAESADQQVLERLARLNRLMPLACRMLNRKDRGSPEARRAQALARMLDSVLRGA